MIKGFKEFILRGSVVDLAVGVLIGASFGTVVSALVKDIFTPLIAAIVKQPDFSDLSFTVRGSTFMYGDFLNALISFLISALAIYLFVVVPINKLKGYGPKKHEEATTKNCPECLSSIPKGAKRCAYCTSIIGAQ